MILVEKLGFVRCNAAPQFYWNSTRLVALDSHMDDTHEAASPGGRKQFTKVVTGVSGENRMSTSRD